MTSLIVIVTSAVDLVDSSRPDCETNECEISSTTVAWHAHCTPGSFPLVGSLARTSYFAGCRRGLLCSATCATVQLCNERLLAQPFSHHCATLEGPSAPKWGGSQCNSGSAAADGWAECLHCGLASYSRNPAISLCQGCSKLLCARPVQREWHRQGGQVDGHLGGECRRGMGLGLTLESCFTTVSKASPCGAPRTA